LSLKQSLF